MTFDEMKRYCERFPGTVFKIRHVNGERWKFIAFKRTRRVIEVPQRASYSLGIEVTVTGGFYQVDEQYQPASTGAKELVYMIKRAVPGNYPEDGYSIA